MKSNFHRWLAVFSVLMIIMSLSTSFALLIKPIVAYFNTGNIDVSVIDILSVSIKVGALVSALIVVGLWIKYRFNIR